MLSKEHRSRDVRTRDEVGSSASCRAASVSERSEANDRVPFEILLSIYMYIYVYMYVRNVNGDGRNGQTMQAGDYARVQCAVASC